jgi:hypothetical protein
MENVKSTKEYKIFKKKSGRYAVKNEKGKWVNGDDKVQILLKEKLIKVNPAKKVEAAPAEETPAQ